ncbi:MAG TPA: DUF3054 domain-containing protein [Acidimicrobiales bacterium]|nr:DUF3054 domain-containing protein [Acidimicrobiales bacterium]
MATGATVDRGGGHVAHVRSRGAALVDVVAVLLFVVIGRASHQHGDSPAGIASTAWPFAVGLGVGWALVAAGRRHTRPASLSSLPAGAAVCITTVAVGMTLRVVAGQGTAAAFVGVATGFLGLVMLAGRLALDVAGRRRVRQGRP